MTIAPRFWVSAAFHALLAVALLLVLASAADLTWSGDIAAPGSTGPLHSADVATFNSAVANTRANHTPINPTLYR